jgi:hypothetical protein
MQMQRRQVVDDELWRARYPGYELFGCVSHLKAKKCGISLRIGLSNGTYHPNADLIWPDTRMGIFLAPILNFVLFVFHNGPIKKFCSKP